MMTKWIPAFLITTIICGQTTVMAAPEDVEYVINNPTPDASDQFGSAIVGDDSNIVIGAPFDSAAAAVSGAAYIFNAATGALLHTLANPSPAVLDKFGSTLAIHGNLVAVGAPGDNSGAGSVYLYNLGTGAFIRTLTNPAPQLDANFGQGLALSSAGVLVGVPNHNTTVDLTDVGIAYLFDPDTGTRLKTFSNPEAHSNDKFGYSAAASGNDLLIGAPGDTPMPGNDNKGRVFIFDASSGDLVRNLVYEFGKDDDFFGDAIDIDGDITAVSATFAQLGQVQSGDVYTFDSQTGVRTRRLVSPSTSLGGILPQFGDVLKLRGNRILIGSKGANVGNAFDAGRAYLYNLDRGNLEVAFFSPKIAINQHYGSAVAFAGKRAVIGAPIEAVENKDGVGRVYVYANPILPREIVDFILGRSSFSSELDVNGDTEIDVADLVRSYLPN